MMTATTNKQITAERIRQIEATIGHKLPEPFSATLMEDCRVSTPEFAAEIIAAAKQVYATAT